VQIALLWLIPLIIQVSTNIRLVRNFHV